MKTSKRISTTFPGSWGQAFFWGSWGQSQDSNLEITLINLGKWILWLSSWTSESCDSSQDCQHVLSSSRHQALQQEASCHLVCTCGLPANFMLINVLTLAPGFEAGVWLLQGGRRPSTVKSYDPKWLKFEAFTSQVQDDTGTSRMSALPASSQTVVTYLYYLLESVTINAKSF